MEHLLRGATKTSIVMTPVLLSSSKKLSSKIHSGPQQMSSNIQTPDRVAEVDVSPIDPLGTPVVVSTSTYKLCKFVYLNFAEFINWISLYTS